MATEKIDCEIMRVNRAICRHIDNIERDDRGEVAQDVVTDLRHFVEHIMLKIYANNQDIDDNYENICKGIKFVESKGQYKDIRRFHDFLQMVVSHYKPDEENSERLMLKYYNYLFEIRHFLREHYDFEVLENLEKFPLHMDPKLKEYYEKIAREIERFNVTDNCVKGSRFYIQKIKPFFVDHERYFEVTFSEATDKNSKTDRLIAFTKIPLMSNYASKMLIVPSDIEIMGKKMPVNIIIGWEVAIRDCEFKNFCSVITGLRNDVGRSETRALCQYMTKTKLNLVDIVLASDKDFRAQKNAIEERAQVTVVLNALSKCIVIHNSMNTPFYLKEGYHGLFANNIYVRLQDSNTPIDKSADINQVEYLWKKRFGLISTPNEKVLKYLEKHDDWISSPVYDDVRFYKYSPEYTIECTCDNNATAYEFYMFRQVDHTPHWYDIEIKFHQTVIDCCKAVSLDGGRYFTAAPNRDGISVERLHGWDVVFHYYIKGTLRYLLHKYYYEENKESCRYNHEDFIPFILIFDSENEKDCFKEYVHSNWEQYKETKNLDVLRISPMKGYNVEEFIKEDRDAQILQLMLRTFRKER